MDSPSAAVRRPRPTCYRSARSPLIQPQLALHNSSSHTQAGRRTEPGFTGARASPFACRAYKLGKSRWSYNQVDLVLREEGGGAAGRSAGVVLAAATAVRFTPAHQASEGFFAACLMGGLSIWLSDPLCVCLAAHCPQYATRLDFDALVRVSAASGSTARFSLHCPRPCACTYLFPLQP